MKNTITWLVLGLTVLPKAESLSDVVIRVQWQATAVSPKGTVAETGTATEVGLPDPEAFTPYDQLTQDQVIAWVQEALGPEGVTAVTTTLDRIIEAQENPEPCPIPMPLPWSPAR